MLYELILTDKCNRNCDFCWVKKGSYVASKDDVMAFIQKVKFLEDQKSSLFKISLFGGEPLLNIDGIRLVNQAFQDDPRCQIDVTTNGDFISSISDLENMQNINWHITAYDFKTRPEMYLSAARKLEKVFFSYTFTEKDLDSSDDFRDFARKEAKCQYKIAFSHTPSSWGQTKAQDLYQKVREIMLLELEDAIYDDKSLPVQSLLANHYLKLVFGFMANSQEIAHPTCISQRKMSFYQGKMIGNCLLLHQMAREKKILKTIIGCCGCKYECICSKSCIAEVAGETVDEKLCMIQKACFDSILDFAEKHQCNTVWRDKIVKMYLSQGENED